MRMLICTLYLKNRIWIGTGLVFMRKKYEGKSMSGEWVNNSVTDASRKPPQHKEVEILVRGGKVLRATWLKDVNKYVKNVNSWHIIGTGNYIKDSDVIGWRDVDNTDSTDNEEK